MLPTKTKEKHQMKALLQKGYGYWDTTEYPFGGCFRRASEDLPIELTGKQHKNYFEFTFGLKRKGWGSCGFVNPDGSYLFVGGYTK